MKQLGGSSDRPEPRQSIGAFNRVDTVGGGGGGGGGDATGEWGHWRAGIAGGGIKEVERKELDGTVISLLG